MAEQPRPRRRFQFRLRTPMIVVAIIALLVAALLFQKVNHSPPDDAPPQKQTVVNSKSEKPNAPNDVVMKPTPEAIAEARKHPNGHVYAIEGNFGPSDAVPPQAIKGAWKVDAQGNIVGDFIPNPNYQPKSR